MPFRTDVLNVSLQNTPDMVSLDRGCQCKTLFWLGQGALKMDAFQDRCSQCDIAKYPRHGISYDRGCQCKTLFWLGQSAPKMDAFSTDVLNVTLCFVKAQWMPFMTEILNVKLFFVATKCFQIL